MTNETIKELTEFINSYKKDSLTQRVLLDKSANILKLINNALERQKKELIKKIEDLAVFTYLDKGDERILSLHMSEKVWDKEFKE